MALPIIAAGLTFLEKGWETFKGAKSLALTGTLITNNMINWAITITFFISVIGIFNGLWNTLNILLLMISNPADSLNVSGDNACFLNYVSYALNAIGLYDIINSCLIILVPTFTFVISVFVYNIKSGLQEKINKNIYMLQKT